MEEVAAGAVDNFGEVLCARHVELSDLLCSTSFTS